MTGKKLLILDDDPVFAKTLTRSFERRGYDVTMVVDPLALPGILDQRSFDYAIVDLKLGTHSGLSMIEQLKRSCPDVFIVIMTGFASISTAVEAIKLGASHYLPKPCTTDELEAAFLRTEGDSEVPISSRPTSIKVFEWEKIQKTLADSDFNISEAARRLGMHRRTLARKLAKQPMR
ncbi:response regulator transcription factor [Sphingomonas jaspsi]|uniref:response regulator transcription factor n=1 Tax=Sphingomonas jaspsi TaxID=392409 RepID=UPI0004BB6260|nr:response regulator transcription factor [Sphingomonas jaspsi]